MHIESKYCYHFRIAIGRRRSFKTLHEEAMMQHTDAMLSGTYDWRLVALSYHWLEPRTRRVAP